MTASDLGSPLGDVLRRILHLFARPVKRDAGRGGLVIQPYRGYGTRREVRLTGRVFRQPGFGADVPEGTLLRDVIDVVRRLLRWGLADVTITARLAGTEHQATTDGDGYFRLEITLDQPLPDDRLWHEVELEMPGEDRTTGEVYVPPATARRVVISDIDDTVMYTGVAQRLMMLYRLFVQDADRRTAFPGVGPLYQALHDGPSGRERNPMLYVSRGPWSISEVLEAFFQMQEIPVGPVLFLREWGMTLQHPLPKRSKDHKRDLVRAMLKLYDDRPFVLVGDSGQHDAELYAEIVREHPGRVEAVYIRNVSRGDARRAAIERLAEQVAEAGSTLLLAADSLAMARHAAEHGLIAAERLREVEQARAEQPERAETLRPTRHVDEHAAEATAEHGDGGEAAPPNVEVER